MSTDASADVTTADCPACSSQYRLTSDVVSTAARAVAKEIARGGDLGGILELAHALVVARVEAGVAGDAPTIEALQAAATVVIKTVRVVAEFQKLGVVFPSATRCLACDLRDRLKPLIHHAAGAAARRELLVAADGPIPGLCPLSEACRDLAHYAGDDYPDAEATLAVLDLAADVFVLAARD